MMSYSDDDGVSWSEPLNLTKQLKKPEWHFLLQGPGAGITMKDGTLVFASPVSGRPEKDAVFVDHVQSEIGGRLGKWGLELNRTPPRLKWWSSKMDL